MATPVVDTPAPVFDLPSSKGGQQNVFQDFKSAPLEMLAYVQSATPLSAVFVYMWRPETREGRLPELAWFLAHHALRSFPSQLLILCLVWCLFQARMFLGCMWWVKSSGRHASWLITHETFAGKNLSLKDFSGKWLVLYFYPKVSHYKQLDQPNAQSYLFPTWLCLSIMHTVSSYILCLPTQ
jgi:hypothetical protein